MEAVTRVTLARRMVMTARDEMRNTGQFSTNK